MTVGQPVAAHGRADLGADQRLLGGTGPQRPVGAVDQADPRLADHPVAHGQRGGDGHLGEAEVRAAMLDEADPGVVAE